MVCWCVLVLVEGDGWGGRGSRPEGWGVPTVALEGERAAGGEAVAPVWFSQEGEKTSALPTPRFSQVREPTAKTGTLITLFLCEKTEHQFHILGHLPSPDHPPTGSHSRNRCARPNRLGTDLPCAKPLHGQTDTLAVPELLLLTPAQTRRARRKGLLLGAGFSLKGPSRVTPWGGGSMSGPAGCSPALPGNGDHVQSMT